MENSRKGSSRGKQINQLMTALGGMAEMAHQVYMAMTNAGADRQEATAAMTAWITAFWHETSEDSRRKNKGDIYGDAENPG